MENAAAAILAWVLFTFLAATVAVARGRSGILWAMIALVASPLIALIALFALNDKTQDRHAREQERSEQRRCPYCDELIRKRASICKHCQQTVPPMKLG